MQPTKQELPDVELDQSTLDNFKSVVAGFPEAQRKQFSDKFNSIDDPQYKLEIIHDVLADHGKRNSQSNMKDEAIQMAGNASMGGPAMGIGNGVRGSDIPGVLADTANLALGGGPRMADQQKMPTALAGMPGAGMAQGANMASDMNSQVAGPMGSAVSQLQNVLKGQSPQVPFPQSKEILPSPKTLAGKIGGQAAGLVAGAGMEKLLNIPRFNKASQIKVLDKLKKNVQGGADLADELSAMADEARKTAGATQGGYIDANASGTINESKMNGIIDNLPNALKEDIMSHPNITKSPKPRTVIDATGNKITEMSDPTIDPTLKNAETIRGIIKGRVPASKWNIKSVDEATANLASQGYDDIGNVMKEGRPELAEAMGNYADVKNAQKQIVGRLETKTGMTKSNPVLEMFGKNVDASDVQAIEKLAEQNPDILVTLEKIKKMTNGIEKTAEIKKFVKYLGIPLTGLGITGEVIRRAVSGNKS